MKHEQKLERDKLKHEQRMEQMEQLKEIASNQNQQQPLYQEQQLLHQEQPLYQQQPLHQEQQLLHQEQQDDILKNNLHIIPNNNHKILYDELGNPIIVNNNLV